MMKQKINDLSFEKHRIVCECRALNILEPGKWAHMFEIYYKEFEINGISRKDLIYNFLVNFNFGSELFNLDRKFYSIQDTVLKMNAGMRFRLSNDTIFYTSESIRFREIDDFIEMINKLKELSLKEGISEIDFFKTISKNIFNFSKELENNALNYFHKKTGGLFYYKFEKIDWNGDTRYINRVWCRASIIRNQDMCTVSPIRHGKGEAY